MVAYSDQQLVQQYLKKGDAVALEELIGRHLPLVYGIARKFTGDADTAADIAQESFVKAWKHLKRYDQQRSFATWIATIAQRTALDWLKRRSAVPFSVLDRPETEYSFAESIVDERPLVTHELIAAADAAQIRGALQKLSPASAAVVELYSQGELTFREIAQQLGESLNTVKSRYRRGIEQMQKLLDKAAPKRPRSS